MVLNDGNLVEYDSPKKLIALPGGVFSALWAKHLESHSSDSIA
jgi:ABC-type multidrug transport system fused ATPase/permease subunit